jgi:hypothetical protein
VIFQPSAHRPRWPICSKYCTDRGGGASASSNVAAIDAPCTGICGTPFHASGTAAPVADRIVGAMSTAWQNCRRTSPRAAKPFGQCTTSGSRTPPP